jgi:hypothetical protein
MRIAEHGMLHQPRDTTCQATFFRTLPAAADKDILDALAELQHRCLWWVWLCQVVRVPEHLRPVVAVKVVNRATRTNDEIALVTEFGQDVTHPGVQMRIESRIHTDDSRWWAFLGKHPNQNQVCVVDPVKCVVWSCVNALFSQRCYALLSALEIWDELVVFVFARVNVRDG